MWNILHGYLHTSKPIVGSDVARPSASVAQPRSAEQRLQSRGENRAASY